MKYDLLGMKERREKADRKLIQLMASRAIARWPEPASYEDLGNAVARQSAAETKRIVDEATELGYIVRSGESYYPNNPSLAVEFKVIRCPSCGEVYPIKLWFRAPGMGNELVQCLYCDKDQTAVVFQLDDPFLKELIGPSLDDYGKDVQKRIEERLRPCPCGGSFRHGSPLLCTKCHEAVDRGLWSYFYVIERILDGGVFKGGRDQIWR